MVAKAEEALVVSSVTVAYGERVALREASLALRPGTITAVLGPSGSGKSSLLRAVAGLERAGAGRVYCGGEDVTARAPHERGFGMMFQSGALFSHMNVADNVAYGLARQGLARRQRRARVEKLLDLLGLAGYGERDVATLSGGQAQRVALARALAPGPRVLLLDEPLSSLDRFLRERLAVEVRRLITKAGVAGLYVTHDQDEAFTVADRIAVLIDGRIVREDVPARVWRDPRRSDVATFLGYGPIVDAATAASWGLAGPGRRLALAPGALRVSGPGVPVRARVLRGRDVRGAHELEVALCSGGDASIVSRARAPLGWEGDSEIDLALDPAATAWVTDPDSGRS